MKIMKPGHRRWMEFAARLEGPEGCNFRYQEPNNPASIVCNCEGGRNKCNAEAILKEMGEIDIPGSLLYFERHGGFCDCQILFNVACD